MNCIYIDFTKARTLCVDAKDYFLDSSDLEGDDSGSAHAVSEMKKTIQQLDNIFIPSVRDMMNNSNDEYEQLECNNPFKKQPATVKKR